MRIIVTGDRNWNAPDLAEEVLTRFLVRYGLDLAIVHGGATGIDRAFAEDCGELGIEQEALPARWQALEVPGAVILCDGRGRAYNANARPIRNAEMIQAGRVSASPSTGRFPPARGRRTVPGGRSRRGYRPI